MRLLLDKNSFVISNMFPHAFGSGPSRLLWYKYSVVICAMFPHASGRVPVSPGLSVNASCWSCGRAP